jgi:hypothetical protein
MQKGERRVFSFGQFLIRDLTQPKVPKTRTITYNQPMIVFEGILSRKDELLFAVAFLRSGNSYFLYLLKLAL